jgi:RHS repeat-associated protein
MTIPAPPQHRPVARPAPLPGARVRRLRIGRNSLVLGVILALVASVIPAAQPADRFATTAAAGSGGAVSVPAHPEGTSFNPTQIKDIRAADPGSGINLIDAPAANNLGDARLGYPIQAPPGRNGIMPQIAIGYSSSGGNGWTGTGWDVPMQAVTIDTRWGVPRYDAGMETETYLLNGEQLTPVAHRTRLQARSAEKVFHTRVEGQFRRIVRHGDNPRNYWWEITDKEGTRWFYGGTPETGPVETSTLTDGTGNVAMWSLREMRDTNDNFMRYHCVRVSDPGVDNGSVPGSNLYLQRITYTGHGTTEGPYAVTFVRDRELGEPRRADVSIDARNGFKQVTADLLRKVEVSLNGSLIRRYELDYRTGAFVKTLLRSISQFGEDGKRFNTHEFDYFDDIRDQDGEYQAFAGANDWAVPDDDLGSSIPDGEASALSASTADGAGGHLYVGFNPLVPRKSGSAGAKTGFSAGESEGLLALSDVNGDLLPDKVFRTGSGVFYRPNLSGPTGQPRFGDTPIRLTNLPGISTESSRSGTSGVESYIGVAAQLNHVSTTSRSDRYFSDVNGDGITDLVSNGSVLFGFLDADGNPSYSANSNDTPVPIGDGTASGDIVGDQTAEFERQVDSFPLLDSVRRWVAPYDGVVAVTGGVRLVGDPGTDRTADGVRVAIQHENAELWARRIMPDDHAEHPPSDVDNVEVRRGDRLYFRVQSILDGRFDQVAWNPDINYVGVPAGTDVNGLDHYRFLASRDFTLGGRPSTVTAPVTGTLRLSGDFSKVTPTTDDVTVLITRNGNEEFSRTLPAAETGTIPIGLDIPVTANDTLSWRVRVDSPIDAGAVHWVPSAHYTEAEGDVPVVDDNGDPTLTISPPYDLDLYPVTTSTAPQGFHTATESGELVVEPTLAFDFGGQAPDTRVVFTVKRRGDLVAKRVIEIEDGVVPSPESLRLTVQVSAGDELFFDFSTLDATLPARLVTQSASVSTDGVTFTPVPSALHASAGQGAFPQPYRGWGAIGYQANRDRASQPIRQADLVVDESYADQLPDAPTEGDVPEFDGRVAQPRIVVFAPMPARGQWGSDDENTWVAADGAASSRLGTDTINVARNDEFVGASAVSRVASTQQISTTLGAGIPGIPIGAGASVARGSSTSEIDFLDLNGDRFPDVVGSGGIQYSDMNGGLGDTRGSLGGNVRESETTAFTVSANAGSPARTASNANGQGAPAADESANTAKSGSEMPGLGIGGSMGGGEADAAHDLLDINGDSLPDRVFENGTAALNLGYRFAAAEPWPGGPVNDGDTTNRAISLGFNTDFYGLAGGLSSSTGSSKTDASLMDLTGDGLLDRVFSGGSGPVSVAINTGNGFAARTPFHGSLSAINADANATLGGGAYFTFGFCLGIIAGGCVVFNPGADTYTGIGRSEVAMRDVNGDGYIDHVRSTEDSELRVAENRTGRTNLLRSVTRPLGARIELDYTRDGNTFDQPQSRWVLSRTTVVDGQPGDGQDVQLTSYRYENGRHDRLEREFFGYGRVVTEQRDPGADDAVYRTVTNDYLTDSFYTRGLPARTRTADDSGRMFLETRNTYQLRDVDTGSPADPSSTTATVFPQPTRTDRFFYEGQQSPGVSTHTETEYDEFGNVIRVLDAADTGPADDVETRTGYTATDPACRSRHIIGVPNFIQVRGTATNTLFRHRESIVDCSTANVKQVRAFLDRHTVAVTDMDYFGNGNLKSVTGPPNKKHDRYKLSYGYDTVAGVHVESIVDSFGYRSSATHDLKFGQPTVTTDQNDQQIKNTYDSFGRVDTITGPYETYENRLTIDFEYHPDAEVPYAVTRHVDRTATGVRDDTIDTIQFVDGLNRTLQTKKDASVPPEPGREPERVMTVSGRVVFDFAGRATEQFFPVTEPKGADNEVFNPAFDSVTPTRLSYDVLDRVTRTVIPDGTATSAAFGFGQDRSGATRFETVSTDANGNDRRNYVNVRELTTSVKEFNPAGHQPVIWTSYDYDPIGQITSVADDQYNTTKLSYDGFGRRTIVDSPDAGRTESRFDLADNLIAKITPNLKDKHKAIEYDYDFTRLAGIRFPVFEKNDVRYVYGPPGARDNGADRIVKVFDAAGTVTREYGPLGEVVKETRTLDDRHRDPAALDDDKSFTTQTRFDAWNRVLTQTYPDGERLTYNYDTGGQVNSAKGVKGKHHYTYLSRMDYDKFEQKAFMETGNGVRTSYTYDPGDRRLAVLNSKLPNGHEFQDLNYTYDDAGNVTKLRNDLPKPRHDDKINGPSTQTFAYDDLYRLTVATGEYQRDEDKLDRYRMELSYDTIHNTKEKKQRHEIVRDRDDSDLRDDTTYHNRYDYRGQRPHAPTEIGEEDRRYDDNGNLIDVVTEDHDRDVEMLVGVAADIDERRQLVWDEENRLACTQDDEKDDTVRQDPSACDKDGEDPTARFVYDDSGNRVIKDGKDRHISPNRFFSETDGDKFKHIFAGDDRLLTKKVENDHDDFEDDQFYFHTDHLGSSSYVTDKHGKLSAHQEFFAFGETWVSESDDSPPVPYQYNGKEFDSETGLYYYGDRYYDPRTNLWQSPDPLLGSYVDGTHNGGVYRPVNLAAYTYTYNNPVRLIDPSGATPEEHWLAEYEKTIDELPSRYDARRVLTDPDSYNTDIPAGLVGALADHRFCERVGADACSQGALQATFGSTTQFMVGAATTFVIGTGSAMLENPGAKESARLVKESVDRQLTRGWSELIRNHLSPDEQRAYQNDLNNKRWQDARRWLGTALHNAVSNDLDRTHRLPDGRGRFEYNRSRGPDYNDRSTGVKVELTTRRGFFPHLARGGAYTRAPHVIYRQPGRLPSLLIRGR